MMRKAVCILVASLGFTAIVAPVSAHHSGAWFDRNKIISIEGVITEVQWKNPHMWVYLDVSDKSGKTVKWGIEGPGSTALVDSGISPALMKVGARVIIKANPSTDQSNPHEGSFRGLVVNGKNYYPRGAIIDGQ